MPSPDGLKDVRLYRVFDWDGTSQGTEFGGPLFVQRARQGAGRHDAPEFFGAWYWSQSPVGAVAETLQYLRGHTVDATDFVRANGLRKALATVDLVDRERPIDLDDPRELVRRHWRPSRIATLDRATTQAVARAVFDEGAVGFCWWSALEASWINVTLFHERALRFVSLVDGPRLLTPSLAEVRDAAEHLGIQLQ